VLFLIGIGVIVFVGVAFTSANAVAARRRRLLARDLQRDLSLDVPLGFVQIGRPDIAEPPSVSDVEATR
jgi:hypothetical protein